MPYIQRHHFGAVIANYLDSDYGGVVRVTPMGDVQAGINV
jgi:hypothetical protein